MFIAFSVSIVLRPNGRFSSRAVLCMSGVHFPEVRVQYVTKIEIIVLNNCQRKRATLIVLLYVVMLS